MKKKWRFLWSLTFALVALAFVGCSATTPKPMTVADLVAEAEKEVRQLSVAESKAKFDEGGYIFLDCREPKEYKMGHIPSSMLIPRGLMEWEIEKKIADKNTKIIMYCKSGGRSNIAAHAIQRMGYANVYHLHGGWLAWQKAGHPAE